MPRESAISKSDSSLFLSVDKASGTPVFRQIASQVKAREESGLLKAGEKLPSVRGLAACLSISVDTVLAAYRELEAEGLAEARPRRGYFAATPPRGDISVAEKPGGSESAPEGVAPRELTENARIAGETLSFYRPYAHLEKPFALSSSFMAESLEHEWIRLSGQLARSPWLHSNYTEPAGYRPLREAVAMRLRKERGIAADADDIIITSSAVQSLGLALDLLFSPGDGILVSRPALPLSVRLMAFRKIAPRWCGTDDGGMLLEEGLLSGPDGAKVRGALVSPASHMPLSVPMTLPRREKLLCWARETGAWILEDDADNGVWFGSEPMQPLRGMPGGDSCVIYLGSFSQLIAPGLRIAYAAVPKGLSRAFAGAKLMADRCGDESRQAVLAEFLMSDAYDSHQRKMQKTFRERSRFLSGAIREKLAPYGRLMPAACGPRLVFRLRDGSPVSDRDAAAALRESGVVVSPLSYYATDSTPENGFVLGFSAFPKDELEAAVQKLAACLAKLDPEARG